MAVNKQIFSIGKDSLSSVLVDQHDFFIKQDLGIQREILIQIKKYLKSPMVIVITGLRRVGKSILLGQLANKFLKDNYYFVNFEDERLINFQTNDFDLLHEILISLFGEKKIFIFDEIQNVPQWERFVRRLSDQGYKFIITGSNASLLSQELGTRLTGRTIRVELFPFSFREFINFRRDMIPDRKVLTTVERGRLLNLVEKYMRLGGIPDSLKYPDLPIHKNLYDDVLYRDIASRYKLDNVKSLKELAYYLISNYSTLISYNKLKDLLALGSANTVKSYIDYLQNSWLFFVVEKYAFSVKEQQIAAKKIYSIDNGLISSVGFRFSGNKGKFLENMVFLHLKRKYKEIYYYKTKQGYEVDFYLPDRKIFIQTVSNIDNNDVFEREIRALVAAYKEQKEKGSLFVISLNLKDQYRYSNIKINIVPVYEWLLDHC